VLIKSAAKDLERLNRGYLWGEEWTSDQGKAEKSGHASTSHLLSNYSKGFYVMGKEDFQERVEELYKLAYEYEYLVYMLYAIQ